MFARLYQLFTGRDGRWPSLRRRWLADHPLCAACGCDRDVTAHHVDPVSWYPDRELDETNLLTLCDRCHLFVGHLGNWSSYNPEARRDADIWLRKVRSRPKREEDEQLFGF